MENGKVEWLSGKVIKVQDMGFNVRVKLQKGCVFVFLTLPHLCSCVHAYCIHTYASRRCICAKKGACAYFSTPRTRVYAHASTHMCVCYAQLSQTRSLSILHALRPTYSMVVHCVISTPHTTTLPCNAISTHPILLCNPPHTCRCHQRHCRCHFLLVLSSRFYLLFRNLKKKGKFKRKTTRLTN